MRNPLSTYLVVLRRPGAVRFSAAALLGRLPIAMVGLGIVLLVEEATGSYGTAGAVSAVALVANGVGSLAQGRLYDEIGQTRLLGPLAVTWAIALGLLTATVSAGAPMPVVYGLAAVAGLTLPALGTCVRARWSHVEKDSDRIQTAYAWESVLDEVVFITGPILVTVLATAISPVVGLGTALVAGLTGTLALAAHRASAPPPSRGAEADPSGAGRRRAPMPWLTVIPLTVASASLGVIFGAVEVTTVAFSEERGSKAVAGLLLALYAVGSLVAGVVSGAVTWRATSLTRLRYGAAAMLVAVAPLTLIDSRFVMGVVLLFAGLAIAPTLIASMTLCEQVLPPSRLTEGMAFVHTGIVVGVAPGAAVAGAIVDASGASAAYLVCVVGGVMALLSALATRVQATRIQPHDAVA